MRLVEVYSRSVASARREIEASEANLVRAHERVERAREALAKSEAKALAFVDRSRARAIDATSVETLVVANLVARSGGVENVARALEASESDAS